MRGVGEVPMKNKVELHLRGVVYAIGCLKANRTLMLPLYALMILALVAGLLYRPLLVLWIPTFAYLVLVAGEAQSKVSYWVKTHQSAQVGSAGPEDGSYLFDLAWSLGHKNQESNLDPLPPPTSDPGFYLVNPQTNMYRWFDGTRFTAKVKFDKPDRPEARPS